MPEIQEIASLSGQTSENKTESSDAIAVTLTGTIGLPTVAMVSVFYPYCHIYAGLDQETLDPYKGPG